jgi:5-methyltetrahydrofolate--homocysteine methyltransferase
MSSYSLIEALGSGRPLLLDGGMGTTMREQSLTASEAHEAFLAAGAEIITADTVAFATALTGEKTRQMLAEVRGCVQAALDARSSYLTNHPGRPIRVAGSVGPLPAGFESRLPDALSIYRRMADALASAGADIILIETATNPEVARMALRAAREVAPGLPAILSAWLPEGYQRGLPVQFGRVAREEGAGAAGLNCVPPTPAMLEALTLLQAQSGLPGVFYPSIPAGFSPEAFSEFISSAFHRLPTPAILGGCCGASPAHLSSLHALPFFIKESRRFKEVEDPKDPKVVKITKALEKPKEGDIHDTFKLGFRLSVNILYLCTYV